MDKKIILIGGAPTTGKSTMASLLAKHFSIPWISTDQIRDIMRRTVRREDMPKLFTPEGYDAEKFLTKFSAQEIADMEMEQAEATWVGIKGFVEDEYTWEDGFVIEGVNIVPSLIAQDFSDKKNVKPVFLVDEDADRIRDVVFNRGLWGDADTYPDYVKEKEIEWVRIFSHRIKTEAEKYNYPTIEVVKQKDDLAKVLQALGLK